MMRQNIEGAPSGLHSSLRQVRASMFSVQMRFPAGGHGKGKCNTVWRPSFSVPIISPGFLRDAVSIFQHEAEGMCGCFIFIFFGQKAPSRQARESEGRNNLYRSPGKRRFVKHWNKLQLRIVCDQAILVTSRAMVKSSPCSFPNFAMKSPKNTKQSGKKIA